MIPAIGPHRTQSREGSHLRPFMVCDKSKIYFNASFFIDLSWVPTVDAENRFAMTWA